MVRDFKKIAASAAQFGITYPTNSRMDDFLSANSFDQDLLDAAKEAFETLKVASRQLTDDHRMVLMGRAWGWRTLAKLEGAISKAERKAGA